MSGYNAKTVEPTGKSFEDSALGSGSGITYFCAAMTGVLEQLVSPGTTTAFVPLTEYLAPQHRALRSYGGTSECFAGTEALATYMNFPFSVLTTLMMIARIQSSSEPGLFTILFQSATFRPAARGTLPCFFEGPTEPVRSRGGKVMETPRPWAVGPGVPAGDEALGRLLRLSASNAVSAINEAVCFKDTYPIPWVQAPYAAP